MSFSSNQSEENDIEDNITGNDEDDDIDDMQMEDNTDKISVSTTDTEDDDTETEDSNSAEKGSEEQSDESSMQTDYLLDSDSNSEFMQVDDPKPNANTMEVDGSEPRASSSDNRDTGAVKKGNKNSMRSLELGHKNEITVGDTIYDLKLVRCLKLNEFIFNCLFCSKDINLRQGFILRSCSHSICGICMINYFKTDGGAGTLICPKEDCERELTINEVNDLVLLINPPSPSKSMKSDSSSPNTINEDHSFYELSALLDVDLISNPEAFICKICFEEIPPKAGVRLHECLHDFCKMCLINTIKNSPNPSSIKCPYMEEYKCEYELQQREIKELLTTYDYYDYLRKTIQQAEMNIQNSFHCKTPNCHNFWEVIDQQHMEQKSRECESCKKINCFECEAIHHPLTCSQYKLGNTENKTMKYVNDMVDNKKFMKCSKCNAVIEKIEGCDGIVCRFCQTKLCWATKGPRWGPNGDGDKSGGCGCDYKNNRPCAPGCNNCH